MATMIELCASTLEPHHLVGVGSAGMALSNGNDRPRWWPRKGQDIKVRIRNSKLLTKRMEDALHRVKQLLARQGSDCEFEFEH